MQGKDQRVCALGEQIVAVMRQHPRRHEAFDALDVAKVLFRPSLPSQVIPDLEYQETPADSVSVAQ
jgi:hypothetical protein